MQLNTGELILQQQREGEGERERETKRKGGVEMGSLKVRRQKRKSGEEKTTQVNSKGDSEIKR